MSKRNLLCVNIGSRVAPAGCNCPRNDGYVCKAGHGVVKPSVECETCDGYRSNYSESNPATRHLLYHVYPLRTNRTASKWNLEMLRARLPQFNGIKLVYVVTDGMTDDVDYVRSILGDDGIEYRGMRNDKSTGEVATWIHAWSTVLQFTTGHLFYGHAKGVTHPYDLDSAVFRWTDILYRANLDYPDVVSSILEDRIVAGSFLSHGAHFPKAYYHYSGNFFWCDINRVKEKVFDLNFSRWGLEGWAGRHFTPPGLIFYEAVALNPYDARVMDDVAIAWESWQQKHRMELAL